MGSTFEIIIVILSDFIEKKDLKTVLVENVHILNSVNEHQVFQSM